MAITVCSNRPIMKFLYFIKVSAMILFVCMCTDIPPKQKKNIIMMLFVIGFAIRLVKKTPFVRSNIPFNKT